MKFGITNSSQLIDLVAIYEGCNKIDDAAEYYKSCSKRIEEASTECDKNALSIDGKTLQPTMDEIADAVKALPKEINAFTAEIKKVASQILVQQQRELNEYLEAQKKKKEV